MNILLIGEESAGIQLLRALAATAHRIVGVMASTDGSGRAATVASVARSLGLAVRPAHEVRSASLADQLRGADVHLILNAHSLYIIDEAVLRVATIGAFNLHPGPLPRYAGLNAPSWAIYRGEPTHGVTVHWMLPRIDAGPIAFQATLPIDEDDTGLSLTAKCIRVGVPLMLDLVRVAAEDPRSIPAVPQDLSRREYFGKAVPRDGRLVWSEPARQVLALIRAADYHPFASPWGHPRARYRGQALGIVKAARTGVAADAPPGVIARAGAGIRVATGDEWVSLGLVHAADRYVRPEDVLEPGARVLDG